MTQTVTFETTGLELLVQKSQLLETQDAETLLSLGSDDVKSSNGLVPTMLGHPQSCGNTMTSSQPALKVNHLPKIWDGRLSLSIIY